MDPWVFIITPSFRVPLQEEEEEEEADRYIIPYL
jgi:hypothetical protein